MRPHEVFFSIENLILKVRDMQKLDSWKCAYISASNLIYTWEIWQDTSKMSITKVSLSLNKSRLMLFSKRRSYRWDSSKLVLFDKPTVCVFFSCEQKINNSGEFSPNYRRFSRTLNILFTLRKTHTVHSGIKTEIEKTGCSGM